MEERLKVGGREIKSASEAWRNADQLRAKAYELLIGRNGRSGGEVQVGVVIDTNITRNQEVTI